jgi:ribonucleoside-diphosphate reductase alpha chain
MPAAWSQTATDSRAQKYFRERGVPDWRVRYVEPGIPEWLQRLLPASEMEFGAEMSAKSVFERLAGAWTYAGHVNG